jgi:hypothetical protein
MINMSGTAAMGGPRKRPGGGSMMTKCDESRLDFSGSSSYWPDYRRMASYLANDIDLRLFQMAHLIEN